MGAGWHGHGHGIVAQVEWHSTSLDIPTQKFSSLQSVCRCFGWAAVTLALDNCAVPDHQPPQSGFWCAWRPANRMWRWTRRNWARRGSSKGSKRAAAGSGRRAAGGVATGMAIGGMTAGGGGGVAVRRRMERGPAEGSGTATGGPTGAGQEGFEFGRQWHCGTVVGHAWCVARGMLPGPRALLRLPSCAKAAAARALLTNGILQNATLPGKSNLCDPTMILACSKRRRGGRGGDDDDLPDRERDRDRGRERDGRDDGAGGSKRRHRDEDFDDRVGLGVTVGECRQGVHVEGLTCAYMSRAARCPAAAVWDTKHNMAGVGLEVHAPAPRGRT